MALECPVCLEAYDIKTRKPKVLTCSHSICNRCLTDIVSNSSQDLSMKCPTCRASSKVESINTNYGLLDVVAEKCESCFTEVRVRNCPHCDQQLCTVCSSQHALTYYGIVKAKVDNLRKEILAATERSFEQVPLHSERECEERTINSIRTSFQIKRDELNKHEEELESEIKRISDVNVNAHKEWTAKVDSQLDSGRTSVRTARDKLGIKYDEKCTVDDLLEIDTDVTKIASELEKLQVDIPDSMEYEFLENEINFQKLGAIVSRPSQQAVATWNPEHREAEQGALSAENIKPNQAVECCNDDETRDMFVQQGLDEIADAPASEQIAYLLKDRARLMDRLDIYQQTSQSTHSPSTTDEVTVNMFKKDCETMKRGRGRRSIPPQDQRPQNRWYGLWTTGKKNNRSQDCETMERGRGQRSIPPQDQRPQNRWHGLWTTGKRNNRSQDSETMGRGRGQRSMPPQDQRRKNRWDEL